VFAGHVECFRAAGELDAGGRLSADVFGFDLNRRVDERNRQFDVPDRPVLAAEVVGVDDADRARSLFGVGDELPDPFAGHIELEGP